MRFILGLLTTFFVPIAIILGSGVLLIEGIFMGLRFPSKEIETKATEVANEYIKTTLNENVEWVNVRIGLEPYKYKVQYRTTEEPIFEFTVYMSPEYDKLSDDYEKEYKLALEKQQRQPRQNGQIGKRRGDFYEAFCNQGICNYSWSRFTFVDRLVGKVRSLNQPLWNRISRALQG